MSEISSATSQCVFQIILRCYKWPEGDLTLWWID